MGITPDRIARGKLIIFSDGLDVAIEGFAPNGTDIVELYRHFDGRVLVGFGWGTNLTNDFIGCHPEDSDRMQPISLVCKIKTVNGHPAVKLSDNYRKAMGPPQELAYYRKVFGSEGITEIPVKV
jgi:nicotinate phosphoribosyltransferase